MTCCGPPAITAHADRLTRDAMCATCRHRRACDPIVRVDGRPLACPRGHFTRAHAARVRWAGITWLGVPMPKRIHLAIRMRSLRPLRGLPGCGCVERLKRWSTRRRG